MSFGLLVIAGGVVLAVLVAVVMVLLLTGRKGEDER